MSDLKNWDARPLLGVRLFQNPETPTVSILVLKTSEGMDAYLVTKEALEGLAEKLSEAAQQHPERGDQN